MQIQINQQHNIIFNSLQEKDVLTKVARATAGYLTGCDQIVDNDILTTDLWLVASF